jgi:protein-S-isoprenylcysteine O-methyltransferase Ste14
MRIIGFVFAAGWVAFAIYWIVAALGTDRARVFSVRSVGFRLAAAAVIILMIRTSFVRGHTGTVHSLVLQGLGLAVFLSGLAVAVWARRSLGKNWGMPMTQQVSPQLVTTGPYRYVRHPIYSGLILAVTGTALALNVYGLIVVAIVGAYFAYSATVEERIMIDRFAKTYPTYRRSSKMLIPFVI